MTDWPSPRPPSATTRRSLWVTRPTPHRPSRCPVGGWRIAVVRPPRGQPRPEDTTEIR
ncbi:hypothetical protein NKG94_29225 [Micromonospora sp. M12]